jgi:hypothetical protein
MRRKWEEWARRDGVGREEGGDELGTENDEKKLQEKEADEIE